MFLAYRFRYGTKSFQPKSYHKDNNLFNKISEVFMKNSSTASEASFVNKPNSVKTDDEVGHHQQHSTKVEQPKQVIDTTPIVTTQYNIIEKKDPSGYLFNLDPFDEVPGPEALKKLSSIWKYLPEIGCQATVSLLLSFFNVTQKLSSVTRIGNQDAGPFERLFRKYGPIVKLQGPLGASVVIISKPEHVAKVYEQEGRHPVRSTLDSVEKCRSKFRRNLGSPFNLSGVEWEEMRKALQEPLSKGGERYYGDIENAADMLVRRIQSVKNRRNEVPDNFMSEVMKWGMECICCVVFGKSLRFNDPENVNNQSEPLKLLKALEEATTNICKCESGFQMWRFINTTSFLNLSQACEVIDTFVSKQVRLAQVNLAKYKEELLSKEKNGMPFIENLLLNECMSPEEVLTCIVDLLLIGVNATSSSLAFALYHLAQNQRAQRTLLKELKQILPDKKTPLRYHQLSSLDYLQSCLNESHRLRMPIPTLTRVLPIDIALSNFRIPKGTYMVMDVQRACLKEQNFEKWDKFLPERWSDPTNIQPFSFIPFGHGLRSCIGKQLAEVQLKTCLVKILRNYQVEYNYGEILGTKTVFSLPDRPLKLSFIERED